ncbi:MAG: hypothetical protein CVU39_17535 [Chloroflexi bacterium HGW-Chloroflexi-10]|nr:MAG: hypothetical protein CVU39_17535 [Chloroflexi bacterium HGW-Chloroflexi-10]
MLAKLRQFSKNLPSLLTALVLAITVWIVAVTANDPTEDRLYPRQVNIEIVGQDVGLVLTSEIPDSVSFTLRAPQSVWNNLLNETNPIRAVIDLSGLTAGSHVVTIVPNYAVRPLEVVTQSPRTITISLENLASRVLPVNLVTNGDPAVGYQAGTPQLNTNQITITGPASQVNRVQEIRANLDINQVHENISRTLNLLALDSNEVVVEDVTLSPDRVTVQQEITQRYGYRNVIVSVQVEGQVADGYRMTNIAVFPLAVTVFSANPQIVNELPGYIQTTPLNINGLKDDVDISLPLDLPQDISVVGDRTTVLVRVSVAAVQSSLPLANVPIEIIGLAPNLKALLAPERITLIISGPLPVLDQLNLDNVRILLDLTDYKVGTYQLKPVVELSTGEVELESIQPEFIDVEIIIAPTPTPSR